MQVQQEILHWQGYEICLQRKRIKNLILKIVPPGKVVVSAPLRESEKSIREFLATKEAWLAKNLAKVQAKQDNSPDDGFDGETIWYFGKPLRAVFKVEAADSRKALIYENGIMFITERVLTVAEKQQAVQEFYQLALKRELSRLFKLWEPRLGYYSSKLTIRQAKTRWGSCNVRTAAIMINFRLVYRPQACLEYVVVHELAHLHAADHGPRFKAFLDLHLPDWRERRKLLNNFLFKK